MRYLIKKITFFLLIILSNQINAQDAVDTILNLQIRPLHNNEHCIQTIFNKLNNSAPYLQGLLYNNIYLSEDGEPDIKLKNGIGTIKTTYIPRSFLGVSNSNFDAYKVYLQYSVFAIEKDLFVDKLDIWGNWENVANIFIMYYPTTMNIEYLKNNKTELTSYYIGDKAVFSTEIIEGKLVGRIRVRTVTSNNYKKILIDYKLKKEEYNLKLTIERKESVKKEEDQYRAFLEERKIKIYNYADINKTDYNKLITKIQNESNTFLNDENNKTPYYIKGIIKFDIDTNNVLKINTESIKTDSKEKLLKLIEILNNSIQIKAQQLNGYFVNSSFSYNVNISYETGQEFFKIDRKQTIIYNEPYPPVNIRNEIVNKYNNIGKYTVKYEVFSNENLPTKTNITLVNYKKTFTVPYSYFVLAGAIIVYAVLSQKQ